MGMLVFSEGRPGASMAVAPLAPMLTTEGSLGIRYNNVRGPKYTLPISGECGDDGTEILA